MRPTSGLRVPLDKWYNLQSRKASLARKATSATSLAATSTWSATGADRTELLSGNCARSQAWACEDVPGMCWFMYRVSVRSMSGVDTSVPKATSGRVL